MTPIIPYLKNYSRKKAIIKNINLINKKVTKKKPTHKINLPNFYNNIQ